MTDESEYEITKSNLALYLKLEKKYGHEVRVRRNFYPIWIRNFCETVRDHFNGLKKNKSFEDTDKQIKISKSLFYEAWIHAVKEAFRQIICIFPSTKQ